MADSKEDIIRHVSSNPIKKIMPEFRDLVSAGVYKPANYRDWALRAIPEYGWTASELYAANSIPHVLPDVAVISDYAGKGEQLIINTLNAGNTQTEFLRLELMMIDNDTKLNMFHSLPLIDYSRNSNIFTQENAAFYKEIKRGCADIITVLSPEEVHELHYHKFWMQKTRQRIIEGLFLGNKSEENDFIDSVCEQTKIKRSMIFGSCFSYNAEGFMGLRFLQTTTVESTKHQVINDMLGLSAPKMDDCGNLLAVRADQLLQKNPQYR